MKQRYPIFTLMLFFVVGSFSAFAQRTVTGTIQDPQGNPLPGVNVLVQGTSIGTTSDASGKYAISMSEGSNTLVFSFIGFTTREVTVGNQSTVDVTLEE